MVSVGPKAVIAKGAWTMKKITLIIAVILTAAQASAAGTYSGGDGSEGNPYKIADANDMNEIGTHVEDWNDCFVLTADIDLGQFSGTQFNIIGDTTTVFTGVFDGNGHEISNFTYTCAGADQIGLFGLVIDGEIRDLRLVDPNVNAAGGSNVSSLVGACMFTSGGSLSGCRVEGCNVSGESAVGGLVGSSYGGSISSCSCSGVVGGETIVGGLVGKNYDSAVSQCVSSASVSGDLYVGGLAGNSGGGVTDCYSSGSVEGANDVGGLIGNNSGAVDDCYSSGGVDGAANVGGLMGVSSGTVNDSFWDVNTSGQETSAAGEGKTTAQMQDANTFTSAGWDFAGTWEMCGCASYPRLMREECIWSGTGEPNDPYLICDANQMNAIGADSSKWGKHFKLMADVDLSDYTGTAYNIIGNEGTTFTGSFDGNDHTISNFTYTSPVGEYPDEYIGLFGYVGSGGEIRDLSLVDVNVVADLVTYVGSLAGTNSGRISGCSALGSVTGWISNVLGGLVGDNGGIVTNCGFSGTVEGHSAVGGLAGGSGGTVSKCYSMASVSVDFEYVGGLVGAVWGGGTISDCYSGGEVDGFINGTGGLIGVIWGGTISNCYSTARTFGNGFVGGLVANNACGCPVSNSFWDVNSCEIDHSMGGEGKTTAEMQDPNTFISAGWDFESVWKICGLLGYPKLLREECDGPTGEPNDPYLIYNAVQMNAVGADPSKWGKHFKLMADVDLSDYTGTEYNIIGNEGTKFTGSFDGNDHTISNFTHTSNDGEYIGLFGYVGSGGEIRDLSVVDVNVVADLGYMVGSLAGHNGGTISGSHASGSVMGLDCDSLGGLVGGNNGIVTNCGFGGTVEGRSHVGGLAGYMSSGTISRCYSMASVSSFEFVGGFVGRASGGTISDCYSGGDVDGFFNGSGGLVGATWGGGGTISNCYSTAGGTLRGGLVGFNFGGWTVTNSFWDVDASGEDESDGGEGKSTAEMQDPNTFILLQDCNSCIAPGWDFVGESDNGTEDIWDICGGTNYPRLVWQIPAGDVVCPDGVDLFDYAFFAGYWGDVNCGDSNDCEGSDFDGSGAVDGGDLRILAENWLAGTN